MIALEDGVIRLFKNSKANRAAIAAAPKIKPKRFGWEQPRRGLIVGRFDENETSVSKYIANIKGKSVDIIQLKKENIEKPRLNSRSTDSEEMEIPGGKVYSCEDLSSFEGTVDILYKCTSGFIRGDEYYFFINETGVLIVLVPTEMKYHCLRLKILLDIYQAACQSEGVPDGIRDCAVIFLVPPDSPINNLQSMTPRTRAMGALFDKAVRSFTENQFVAVVDDHKYQREAYDSYNFEGEDEEEDDGYGEIDYNYWNGGREDVHAKAVEKMTWYA
eukprot:gene27914-34700_t